MCACFLGCMYCTPKHNSDLLPHWQPSGIHPKSNKSKSRSFHLRCWQLSLWQPLPPPVMTSSLYELSISIYSRAALEQSNVTQYWTQQTNDYGRIQTMLWTLKRHPISHPHGWGYETLWIWQIFYSLLYGRQFGTILPQWLQTHTACPVLCFISCQFHKINSNCPFWTIRGLMCGAGLISLTHYGLVIPHGHQWDESS